MNYHLHHCLSHLPLPHSLCQTPVSPRHREKLLLTTATIPSFKRFEIIWEAFAFVRNRSKVKKKILPLVWKEWCNGRALQAIDQRLQHAYPVNEALKCLTIALLCVQKDPSKRPNMALISLMLGSKTICIPTPSTPAFFIQGTSSTKMEAENYDRQRLQGIGTTTEISVSGVTITEMGPR
ncbi:cysteine-rich receptor-like protein kinase 33 [Carex littledalei]|uniref:Cysteine-rich receptor-like protein kinase 33 n=1 Tax=Carex littledalei TaxID=544730 RepID=A0A833RZ33_9POAL|nr:cysteine-rich receptor-like protein kinase 33 [Carex littledalei]